MFYEKPQELICAIQSDLLFLGKMEVGFFFFLFTVIIFYSDLLSMTMKNKELKRYLLD